MRFHKILAVASMVLVAFVLVGQQAARIDDAALRNSAKSGDEWLTNGRTPGETRFSPLNQINATNVQRLGLSLFAPVGVGGGGQEATPLISNGVIYGITNWSVLFAINARTGKELWRWDPEVNQAAVRPRICCGAVNRGLALYQNTVIAPVIDGRLVAHDMATGKVLWESRVAYPQDEYTITMAPRIAKGKVIVGVSGGDRPTRGFFSAYDARTGQLAWKFYTVPGDPSKGFENPAMERAAKTWEGEWWKMGGGGAVWDGVAYDPETNLVYVGTGNAEPWPEELRKANPNAAGSDNLYVCSILAVDVDSGQLKWHFQVVPRDSWDFDSVQQLVLADLEIKGKQRKVIMQANKNAFYYVIDRTSGEFISGQPFSMVTWAKGLDEKTGRPIMNPEAFYTQEAITISPGGGGAHNWSPMSFNPMTGLTYIPTSTANSFTYAAGPKNFMENRATAGATGTARPAPPATKPPPPAIGPAPLEGTGGRGALVAWDPVTQSMKWRVPGGGGIGGGTVTTAGNLVFQTINDGRLMAYSADKGEKLLEVATGLRSGMGPPMTYMLDGKQYVALMGGVGQTTVAGPGNVATPNPPMLLIYALDGTAVLPVAPAPPPGPAR
jgi:quinohemoprotein ethanol dehydrogenase